MGLAASSPDESEQSEQEQAVACAATGALDRAVAADAGAVVVAVVFAFEVAFAVDVELGRYLDYCSELLSTISKVAALYAQAFPDSVILSATDQVETLASGLSRKICQKLVLLNHSRQKETQ